MSLALPAGLRFADLNFELETPSVSGGVSLTGAEQVVTSPAARWRATGTAPVHGTDLILAYRAFKARLRGRANTVLVPVLDGRSPGALAGLGLSDDTAFDDDTGFAEDAAATAATLASAAEIGATSLAITAALPLVPGQYFSIGSRLHLITDIAGHAGTAWTVAVEPPLRAAAAAGTALNFDAPACAMRLAADDGGALGLALNRHGVVTLTFVEAF